MATKPKKVRYSGIGVFANGYLLSRVQSFSIDSDLGEEEARELTNSEVVEFTSTTPSVTVNVETNEYGSMRNLRAIAQITGGATVADYVDVNSFDGSAADIGVQFEEDNVLTRTLIVNDAFLTAISWNFDVGGVATEAFTFESDNKTHYYQTSKQAFSLMGRTPTQNATNGSGQVFIPFSTAAEQANYLPIKQYIDGVSVTGGVTKYASTTDGGFTVMPINWFDTNFTATGSRYRTIIVKTGATSTTIEQNTSTSTIGSIGRGRMNIYLQSGDGSITTLTTTNFLRLQSAGVDADLAREVLNELGHFRAFDRSLTLPVAVNLSFSALSSNLEEWLKFAGGNIDATASSTDITQFVKTAKFKVEIYDKQDTDPTRVKLKTLTVSGLQIISESEGVDVGGNATQDFTARASNFILSGVGTPGAYPLTAAPTN